MATPNGNISAFFAKLVSPVIFQNKIVATFFSVMFDLFEKQNNTIDNVTNSDI